MDAIFDFEPLDDKLDLSSMLRRTTSFTDPAATAFDALEQGYVYFAQHGVPGDSDFGTMVYIDHNGGSHYDGQQSAIFNLHGVSSVDLLSPLFLDQLIV